MAVKILNSDYFKNGESIRVRFLSAPKSKTMRSNEFWEIIYIYEGRGYVHKKVESELVKANDVIIIKPGTEYALTSPDGHDDIPARMCSVAFTRDCFDTIKHEYCGIFKSQNMALYNILLSKEHDCVFFSDDDAQNVHNIMWLIAHEYNHYKTGSGRIIENSMLNLIICATRLYEYRLKSIPPTIRTNETLEEVKKYIRSNFAYNITLDFLASQTHLSKEHLSRSFKKYTGKTIFEFLLDVRISRAKQMLRNPNHSIGEISEYCGYNTIGNFQRAFKKSMGISPSEYRKRIKHEYSL